MKFTKSTILISIAVTGVGIVALYYWYYHKNGKISYYVPLGSPFRPEQAGSRGELSNECLQHPGYRMCTLTDGTSGVCGTSGRCVTELFHDIRRNWDEVQMPICYQPLAKEGCQRFCNCQQLKGNVFDHEMDGCVNQCNSNFSPL
jgi:hypothetical protein